EEVRWLRADEESNAYLAPADTPVVNGKMRDDRVLVRYRGDFVHVDVKQVGYMDVAPCQMVGVSAGLIPFLPPYDAKPAPMGSDMARRRGANMQRQAVPLLITEAPVVGTGLERAVAENSGMLIKADKAGSVNFVDA